MMPKSKRVLLCLVILIVSFFVAGHRSALAANSPNGITISPAFQQITVAADVARQPVTFKITNDKNVPQTIKLSAADFNTLNESGGLFFVGTNPTDLQKKYGLAKWFSTPQNEITIAPRHTEIVKANILNLPDMSGGGHYGALMIRIANSSSEPANSNKVAIEPIASSLMFVTKMGGDTHKLSLAKVSFSHSLFKLPSTAILQFSNTGNTHVVPRGIVKVTGPDGRVISQGIINTNSNIVLPGTSRNYTVNLEHIGTISKPSKYKLLVDFRFDGIDQPRGYQTSFWIVPVVWLIVPISTLALVAALIMYAVRRRKYSK